MSESLYDRIWLGHNENLSLIEIARRENVSTYLVRSVIGHRKRKLGLLVPKVVKPRIKKPESLMERMYPDE